MCTLGRHGAPTTFGILLGIYMYVSLCVCGYVSPTILETVAKADHASPRQGARMEVPQVRALDQGPLERERA